MYNYDLIYGNAVSSQVSGILIWTAVAAILAVVGGILIYFLFLKKDAKLSDNLQKIKDLLNFKIMLIEPILKVLYLIITLFIILYSFTFIAINFLTFLLILVLGPIITRVIYEAALMIVMIWKNTKEIANNTKKKN